MSPQSQNIFIYAGLLKTEFLYRKTIRKFF